MAEIEELPFVAPADQGETRLHADHRWTEEGRRDVALAYRMQRLAIYKKDKRCPKDLRREYAWRDTIREFPPLSPDEIAEIARRSSVKPKAKDKPTKVDPEKAQGDLVTDILWVYHNLNVDPVGMAESDCPSGGAYNLWVWAKNNTDKFINNFLPKAMAPAKHELGNGKSKVKAKASRGQVDPDELLELIDSHRRK